MPAKRPLDVHLYVTPECNLACPHCYYDALSPGRHADALMPLAEVETILTGLCDRFAADIHLEGGEPFLRRGLGEMLGRLNAAVLGAITITTNGTVSMGTESEALRALGQLRVSVDGHQDELQQSLRGIGLAPVLRKCAWLQDRQIPFIIRMTLWRRNARHLAELYEWIDANGFEQLSMYEYQAAGRGVNAADDHAVSSGDMEVFLEDLLRLERPACLRRLAVRLAERRVDAVMERRQRFEASGFAVRALQEVANCTINFDRTVGVSPWRVTASGSPDVFTRTDAPDFFETLAVAADNGLLTDRSGCLSQVCIAIGE